MIDFKYSLILGDILAVAFQVYVKINSTPVPCRVPAARLATTFEHTFVHLAQWVQV
jgi:hypothetical protein